MKNHVPDQNQNWTFPSLQIDLSITYSLYGPACVKDAFAAFTPGLGISTSWLLSRQMGSEVFLRLQPQGRKALAMEEEDQGGWLYTHLPTRAQGFFLERRQSPASLLLSLWATNQAWQMVLQPPNMPQTCFKIIWNSININTLEIIFWSVLQTFICIIKFWFWNHWDNRILKCLLRLVNLIVLLGTYGSILLTSVIIYRLI